MGRRRSIAPHRLDWAITQVCLRDGASQISLDALAAAAGISKSGVIYGLSGKAELLEDFVDRHLAAMTADLGILLSGPEGEVAALAGDRPAPAEWGAALTIALASGQDAACHHRLREAIAELARLISGRPADLPRVLATVAGTLGLTLNDSFGLFPLAADQRRDIQSLLCDNAGSPCAPASP